MIIDYWGGVDSCVRRNDKKGDWRVVPMNGTPDNDFFTDSSALLGMTGVTGSSPPGRCDTAGDGDLFSDELAESCRGGVPDSQQVGRVHSKWNAGQVNFGFELRDSVIFGAFRPGRISVHREKQQLLRIRRCKAQPGQAPREANLLSGRFPVD